MGDVITPEFGNVRRLPVKSAVLDEFSVKAEIRRTIDFSIKSLRVDPGEVYDALLSEMERVKELMMDQDRD